MSVLPLHRTEAAPGCARSARPGDASGRRDVLVTRPEILTDEKTPPGAPPFFVDWLSISQEYPEGGLPVVSAGVVWAADEDGQVKWRTDQAVQHQGSYETSLRVKCDGHRVTFSGNVSRFGRPDNLWGFSFQECMVRINQVLAVYGLPPFTAGVCVQRANKRGTLVTSWTGARVSRIDLTANFESGSEDNAHLVMQYLGSQHNGRKNGRVLAQGETVDWGAGSRRMYAKAYVKHRELERHGCEDARLIEHCKATGLVRFEVTVKSNVLTDLMCAFLGEYDRGYAMGQLVQLFTEQAAVMSRAERSTDDLDDLPRHLRATARDYLAGTDTRKTLSQATWYRHRVALLPYGIDIAVRNVRPFQPRVRVVQLAPAVVPSWYQLAA